MTDDDKEEKLYRVETIPPPAGESDAYSAPTKVGPMAASVVAEMMNAADKAPVDSAKGGPLSARGKPASSPSPFSDHESPTSQRAPVSAGQSLRVREEVAPRSRQTDARAEVEAPAVEGPVPRLYDTYAQEDAEEDRAATVVSSHAKAPVIAAAAPAKASLDELPPVSVGRVNPAAPSAVQPPPPPPAEPAKSNWVDYLLVIIIVAAAGAAIYLLRR